MKGKSFMRTFKISKSIYLQDFSYEVEKSLFQDIYFYVSENDTAKELAGEMVAEKNSRFYTITDALEQIALDLCDQIKFNIDTQVFLQRYLDDRKDGKFNGRRSQKITSY